MKLSYLMSVKNIFGIALLSAAVFFAGVSYADSVSPPPVPSEESVDGDKQKETADAAAYERVTFQKLMNLSWQFGLLDPKRLDVVTEYIVFSNCDLYKEYAQDDFKWPEIIDATKAYLEKYGAQGGRQISVIQPIALGKYILDKEWFAVTADTQYLNKVEIEIADFQRAAEVGYYGCGSIHVPRTFPIAANVILPKPFSLTYLPMSKKFAEDYLSYLRRLNNKGLNLNGAFRDRYAFVDFKITITSVSMEKTNSTRAVFLARLDGYTIYADIEKTLKLFSWENRY